MLKNILPSLTSHCSSADYVHYILPSPILPAPLSPALYRIINNKLWTAEDEAKANQVEGRSLAGESMQPATDRQPRVLNQGPRPSAPRQVG